MPETMISHMAKTAFTERFRNCVGENWENASEADKRAHRDMIAAALGELREPNLVMLEIGADVIERGLPNDSPRQALWATARRVMSSMAEAAIREAQDAGELTP